MIEIGSALFIIILACKVPIAWALALVPVLYLVISGKEHLLIAMPQQIFNGMDLFVLMTIPFFILAGNIMNAAKITTRLIDFAQVLVGHIRGGLALVTVVSSMFFAGTSGSAAADVSAIGSVLIPSMVKRGYDLRFAVSIVVIASVIGPIIPPSIAFIIFAVMSDVSIAALFLAGVVPGVLLGFFLMAYSYLYAIRHNYPSEKRASLRQILKSALNALPALFLPFIILGGILSGVFTPTEASAVAVLYAMLVGFFVYGELKLRDLPGVFRETARLTATVMLVVGASSALAWVMASEDVPVKAAAFIKSIFVEKYSILIAINILFLLLGTILEPIGAMVVFLPVLLPIINQLGINQIHFGVVTVLNLVIGLTTPPVGLCLFIGCSIGQISIEKTMQALWPMLMVAILVLMIITFIPEFSLFIPKLFPSLVQ